MRDELAIQLADMTRLHALSERLSNNIELTAVLEEVLSAVTGLQGTERGVLMLYDRERDEMRTAASVGFDPEQLKAVERATPGMQLGGTVTAVISGGIVVADVPSDPILAPQLSAALHAGCQVVCSTPLLTCGGEPVGVIATYFPERHRPSERETRLVELYARQAAEFIDNARLYREIREADRCKGVFLAMLGHELRNPLAPILNALHLMRLPNIDRAEIDQAHDIAEWQARHLARLVDDLLDVSRINSGKIELRKGRVDLREAVSRVETARPLIESRRHSLSVTVPDDPLPLEANTARLEQVLSNLLNNSAKYTEPGGQISLTVERDAGEFVIKVRDNGIGIDPELLPRIFDLFTQADQSLDRSQGGLGIGLTLVRHLVEMHGGSVSASRRGYREGQRIRRPPAGARRGGHGGTPAGARSVQGQGAIARILVVDDNIQSADSLARIVRLWGHDTRMANTGTEAPNRADFFARRRAAGHRPPRNGWLRRRSSAASDSRPEQCGLGGDHRIRPQRRTAVAHRKRGSTCISSSRLTSTTSKNDSRAPKPSGLYSGRPPLRPSSLTIRHSSLRVEVEATRQGLIMVQSISQPTQTQFEQAQQPPPGRLQEQTPPRLEHPRPQAQRQQRRQGHHHKQPQRVRQVGYPTALHWNPWLFSSRNNCSVQTRLAYRRHSRKLAG